MTKLWGRTPIDSNALHAQRAEKNQHAFRLNMRSSSGLEEIICSKVDLVTIGNTSGS